MMFDSNGNRRRVVITGLGMVSPVGNDVASTWQAMMEGVCGVESISWFDTTDFPCTIAAPVKDFNPTDYMDKRDARRMAPFLHFAVAATQEALADARLDLSLEDPTRVGAEIGSAIGGVDVVEEQRLTLERKGLKRVSPASIPALLINMPGCFIAIQYDIQGPVNASVTACATGISGIGEGMRRIVWGDADVMLAGGTEAAITPLTVGAFGRLTALSGRNDTPQKAITPFDLHRDGTVVGEGAGVVVLESLEHAQARGAKILAEVKGYSLTSDAYHISSPRDDGTSSGRAMANALRDAGLTPQDIDYLAAHGTGTPMNDATETKAIKVAFGESAYDLAVSSVKSMTGHTLGAAGAVSVIVAVKAMHEGFIPPTINLETPDPVCDLDYVPNTPRRAEVKVAMANGFGFGGQNASVVLQKWDEASSKD